MLRNFIKKNLLSFFFVSIIFLTDRLSKFYILRLSEQEKVLDIYINAYMNLYLIWNKGIAFGLMSFDSTIVYNFITYLIAIICITILIMTFKSKGFKKYSLTGILGGAMGNLFDRIYYGSVPDFIDIHIKELHWFVFNVADIFITTGIMCLIFAEILIKDKRNENAI